MSRTNIDIDEKAVAAARKLRGSGWSGDLDDLRRSRVPYLRSRPHGSAGRSA